MTSAGWTVRQTAHTKNDRHVVPVDDSIEHTPDDCLCGPRDELWAMEDDTEFWIVIHNSLDGRELDDPGYSRPAGARPIWGVDE